VIFTPYREAWLNVRSFDSHTIGSAEEESDKVISPLNYLTMTSNFRRTLALRVAIASATKPGDRVLDAGCGSLGILGMMALKSGAGTLVGVDKTPMEMAEMTATDNGVRDKCTFVQCDLQTVELSGRFDVILAMVYQNHPRIDERQSNIVHKLRQKYLKAEGQLVPNVVRYHAYACDWPSQDLGTRRAVLAHHLGYIEGALGVSLKTFSGWIDPAHEMPQDHILGLPPAPAHDEFGRLEKGDARILSAVSKAIDLDYDSGRIAYPSAHYLEIISPGVLNSIVWIQEMWFKDMLIYSKESMSWVRRPSRVEPGNRYRIELDDVWRRTNALSIRKVTENESHVSTE